MRQKRVSERLIQSKVVHSSDFLTRGGGVEILIPKYTNHWFEFHIKKS